MMSLVHLNIWDMVHTAFLLLQGFQGKMGPPGPPGVVGPQVRFIGQGDL